MFDTIIEEQKNNIINSVSDLIKFPSVSIESDSNKYPFGIECNNALSYFLELGKSMGFKTKNLDGYCGYVEFGEGEELVGIIGHLDVVPASEQDGWTTPPFSPNIRDGKLYGRGSIDDKGPVIAALYAMKAIKDTINVNKRIRLIVGLNEEKSWKCINYYKENEEWPHIGFSPDANFPGIYAEKGIMSISIINTLKMTDYDILNIDCNNNAINVVPKYVSITIKSKSNQNNLNFNLNENIKVTNIGDNTIKIEAFGIASHAAHPELGKNAIKILVEYLLDNFSFESNYLNKLYELGLFDITSPKFLDNNKIEDESGILTSNIALLDYKDEKLEIKTNLRIPVTYSLENIKNRYNKLKEYFEEIQINDFGHQNPLYRTKDSYLVKTLVDIFNKKTGLNEEPIAIGGGTYARAFDNFISYGATMPGEKDMCHQVDEFIEIESLILSCKIYAEAIYALSR